MPPLGQHQGRAVLKACLPTGSGQGAEALLGLAVRAGDPVSPKPGAAPRGPGGLLGWIQALISPDPTSGTAVALGLTSDDCGYPGSWDWQARAPALIRPEHVGTDRESVLSSRLLQMREPSSGGHMTCPS